MARHKKLEIPGGYLALPNKIALAIQEGNLSLGEVKLLIVGVRWTVGYDKLTFDASYTTLAKCTGLSRRHVCETMQCLIWRGAFKVVQPARKRVPTRYTVELEFNSRSTVQQLKRQFKPSRCGTALQQHYGTAPPGTVELQRTLHNYSFHNGPHSKKPPFPPHVRGNSKPQKAQFADAPHLEKFPKPKAKQPRPTIADWLAMLIEIHEQYFPADKPVRLDPRDEEIANNILQSNVSSKAKTGLLNRFTAYAKSASTNGTNLPPGYHGAMRFMYLLKNRDSFRGEAA